MLHQTVVINNSKTTDIVVKYDLLSSLIIEDY